MVSEAVSPLKMLFGPDTNQVQKSMCAQPDTHPAAMMFKLVMPNLVSIQFAGPTPRPKPITVQLRVLPLT